MLVQLSKAKLNVESCEELIENCKKSIALMQEVVYLYNI